MHPNKHLNGVSNESAEVYVRAVKALRDAGVRFLIGGAYALTQYTGVQRRTKDLDVFCHPNEAERILDVLSRAGFQTTLPYPHWLGKAYSGDDYVDVIFSSSNGIAVVDEDWYTHAVHGEIFGLPVWFCPPEETIWSKAWVMDRERFDGADIAHLLRACGESMDWERLMRRFGPEHYQVLLFHLLHFGFVYPNERPKVPEGTMRTLLDRLTGDVEGTAWSAAAERVCRGTLFSGEQYRIDVEKWGYEDARVHPHGPLTLEDVQRPLPVPPPKPSVTKTDAGATTDERATDVELQPAPRGGR